MKFKKKVVFTPAYDKRNPDPKKNYGIHGADCRFYLIGEKGVVQFVFSTHWLLPHVQEEQDQKNLQKISNRESYWDSTLKWNYHPMPVDIGYHSPVPMYDGQKSMECHFYKDGCYYDGSGLDAERFMNILIEKGSKGVWKEMKNYYRGMFETPPEEKTIGQVGFGQILNALCGGCEEKSENE